MTINAAQTTKMQQAQTRIANVKSELSNLAILARDIKAEALANGDMKEYNAAYRFEGEMIRIRGEAIVAHADASDAILAADATIGGNLITNGPSR